MFHYHNKRRIRADVAPALNVKASLKANYRDVRNGKIHGVARNYLIQTNQKQKRDLQIIFLFNQFD